MDRPRRTWLPLIAVLVGMPVLYVMSFGPACWLSCRTSVGHELISIAYRPIFRLAVASIEEDPLMSTCQTIQWWMALGAGHNMGAMIWDEGTFEWVPMSPPEGWPAVGGNWPAILGIAPAGITDEELKTLRMPPQAVWADQRQPETLDLSGASSPE